MDKNVWIIGFKALTEELLEYCYRIIGATASMIVDGGAGCANRHRGVEA